MLSFIARSVENGDTSKLVRAIVNHGQAHWYGYGIELGLNKSQIVSISFDKPLPVDKLLAIIHEKPGDSIGPDEREMLLEACKRVPSPFYEDVMRELGVSTLDK